MPAHTATLPAAEAFARFNALLQAQGLRPALAFLRSLSEYRYISIFRFHHGKATTAVHYDRDNPDVLTTSEVPESATYCVFARDTRSLFATPDSMTDARLVDHVAREAVQAYCGLPMFEDDGSLLGVLCHYDTVPRDPAQLDLELLVQVTSVLRRGGHVPPYPFA
jgi:GAF domain-containing protein